MARNVGLTPAKVHAAIRDTADTPAAARLLGVSESSVYASAKAWGIGIKRMVRERPRIDYSQWPETPPYPPLKPCSQWWFDLWAMARAGASYPEMEERFNRPSGSLKVTLNRMRTGRPAVASRAAADGDQPPQPAPSAAPACSSHAHHHEGDI